ncbi:MAG: DUF1080 domain-containing protein [Verrucomicrobia bacterium]|nr:DUF1080 domain-containing protein [Verrucomicrobiota bacterium]
MKIHPLFALLALSAVAALAEDKPSPIGYDDTPYIPGTQWRVHDIKRPAPKVVAPGQTAAEAPADAVVLFDGKSNANFASKNGAPCTWKVANGELVVQGGDIWTKESFGSCQLHLEWLSQPETKGNSQKKGNSGIFFMDRYEAQILDCYNNPTYADGTAGAVYGQTPPLVNAVRPPGQWQVYDVIFTAAKVNQDGTVTEPAYVTTIINGICVQNHTKIMGPTVHKQTTSYKGKFPEKAPIRLQDHGNDPPLRFRNIWIRSLP